MYNIAYLQHATLLLSLATQFVLVHTTQCHALTCTLFARHLHLRTYVYTVYRKTPTLINPFCILSFLRVSGGSGTIEVANLKCANGACTYSTNTDFCSHSEDLVIQCGEYCIQSCVCVALSALNIWYTFK